MNSATKILFGKTQTRWSKPSAYWIFFLLHSEIHLWQSSVAVTLEFMDLHEKEIFLKTKIAAEDKLLSIKSTFKWYAQNQWCFWTMQSHVYSTWRNILVRKFSHFFWLKWCYKHINFGAAATSSSGESRRFHKQEHYMGWWRLGWCTIPLGKDNKNIESITMSHALSHIFVDEMDCLGHFNLDIQKWFQKKE